MGLDVSEVSLNYGKAKVTLNNAEDVKKALSKDGTRFMETDLKITT